MYTNHSFQAWMARNQMSPHKRLAWVSLLGFLVPAVVLVGYLLQSNETLLREQGQQWEVSMARALAIQLSKALETQDDLGALAVLRAALGTCPQLREGFACDADGKILWHTDPSRIGMHIPVLAHELVFSGILANRPITSIQVFLAGHAGVALRLVFDESRWVQARRFLAWQGFILLVAAVAGTAWAGWRHLQAYVVFDRTAEITVDLPLPMGLQNTIMPKGGEDSSACKERGQAVLEFILVLGVFAFLITAMSQFLLLGTAHLQCQMAARRATWLWNTWNNASMDHHLAEVQALAPGCKVERSDTDGSRISGMTFRVSQKIPAVGCFRMIKPGGFVISARSAVIAYNPKPKANWNMLADQ